MIKNKYDFVDRTVLRTPILSLDEIDKIENINDLKNILSDSIIKEALFLASPALYKEYIKWINNESKVTLNQDDLINSLMRYILRMGSRPTPFGLFSGVSTVNLENHTKIEPKKELFDKIKRTTRLDSLLLSSVSKSISALPSVKEYMIYYPNTSIYFSKEKLRYVEYKYSKKGKRIHEIISVQLFDLLRKIILKAKKGITYSAMANIIHGEGYSIEESNSFLSELIHSQIRN